MPGTKLQPIVCWRLWVFNAVLVSAAFLFYLATQYGTYEFFGRACIRALLPLIPVLVLVGGAGSTLFALTKVFIEKRCLQKPAAIMLLVGPGVVISLAAVLLAASRSPNHRLAYICAGSSLQEIRQVQITGYSTFLREEWLAVFQMNAKGFADLTTEARLTRVDESEFNRRIQSSRIKDTALFRHLPPLTNSPCYQRIFNGSSEHKRGRILMCRVPDTGMVVALREYRD